MNQHERTQLTIEWELNLGMVRDVTSSSIGWTEQPMAHCFFDCLPWIIRALMKLRGFACRDDSREFGRQT
eukprot:SAG31_NODE_25649_length_457_cov_1.002793_1_plen_69_part_10